MHCLRYLTELVRSGRPLPRRQELESKTFVPPNSEEAETALVSHQEVQTWAEGNRDAIICSISHAWETREHPDPCRYQLEHIVQRVVLYEAAFKADVWVFYDYASLFQFERFSWRTKQLRSSHAKYACDVRARAYADPAYRKSHTRWCLESHDGQRDGTCPCLWQGREECRSQTLEGFVSKPERVHVSRMVYGRGGMEFTQVWLSECTWVVSWFVLKARCLQVLTT